MKRVLILAAAAGLVLTGVSRSQSTSAPAAAPAPAPGAWMASWGASPVPPGLSGPRAPAAQSFSNQTLRQVVRLSAGGTQVRIRISNEFGTAPLQIGAAHVALSAGPGGAIAPGSDHVLTFGGSPAAVIPPGAPLLSDPVDMAVPPLASLAVSLYLPGETGPCSCHPLGVQTGFASGPGDFTGAVQFPAASTFLNRPFLSEVDVRPAAPGKVVVAFGDSLTDGAVSTPDANHRWPDRLAERLNAAGGPPVGVANEGISGNQLLADLAGQNGLARFDRDVLGVAGATHLVVLLGTNDLGLGYGPRAPGRATPDRPPTFQQLTAAYTQMIERAHARGLKVYGATIMPFEGASYWSPEGDALRQRINAWIRTSGAYDGVIDFDAVWRDPARPSQIREGLHAPDHLHGSDAGYAALGDAVDLGLFR